MFDFLGSIGDLLNVGGILDALGQFLAYVVNLVVAIANFLAGAIEAIGKFFLAIVQRVGNVFRWIYEHVFKGVLIKVANAIMRAHQWLEDHLAPVIKFLQKVRAYLDRIFKLYVKPILQLLQKVRQVLMVLRLLHVKWAVALDHRIAQIEGDIARIFLQIRGTLNSVIDTLNSVTTPSKFVRLVAVSVAGRRSAAAVIRLTTGLPAGFFFPTTKSEAPEWERPVKSSKDILSPFHNPPASTILGSLLPAPISDFVAGDPTPTDGEIDAVEPFGYGDQVLLQFIATETAQDALPDILRSPRIAVEHKTGAIFDAGAAHARNVILLLGGA
jgi:hypothetical protein